MSTTKAEIIYDLLNIVRGGQVANSEPVSEEQISYWVDATRAKLIHQDLNKRRSINPDIIQTLCISLEQTDATTCPCVVTGCTILRSSREIPNAIELNHRNLLVSVGPVLITAPRFSFIDYHRAIYYNPSTFSKRVPAAFLYNKRLYVIASTNQIQLLTDLSVEIVLERPSDASVFACSGTPCYTNESKYPLSAFMIEDLKNMIIQNNFKIALAAPSDKTGDLSHDVKSSTEQPTQQ